MAASSPAAAQMAAARSSPARECTRCTSRSALVLLPAGPYYQVTPRRYREWSSYSELLLMLLILQKPLLPWLLLLYLHLLPFLLLCSSYVPTVPPDLAMPPASCSFSSYFYLSGSSYRVVFRSGPYRILYSVLLSTAVSAI